MTRPRAAAAKGISRAAGSFLLIVEIPLCLCWAEMRSLNQGLGTMRIPKGMRVDETELTGGDWGRRWVTPRARIHLVFIFRICRSTNQRTSRPVIDET